MTIVKTDMMESRVNETYEEPEDEVQEVRTGCWYRLDGPWERCKFHHNLLIDQHWFSVPVINWSYEK